MLGTVVELFLQPLLNLVVVQVLFLPLLKIRRMCCQLTFSPSLVEDVEFFAKAIAVALGERMMEFLLQLGPGLVVLSFGIVVVGLMGVGAGTDLHSDNFHSCIPCTPSEGVSKHRVIPEDTKSTY